MFQLVILVCLFPLFCKCGECEEVYIIPSMDTPCPKQTCYTLMQFINCITCQSSSVALIFMPGNHVLGTEYSITAKSCFSMSVYDNSSVLHALVQAG